MGIETIFIVVGVAVIVAVVVAARKSKQKIQDRVDPPESGRPPS